MTRIEKQKETKDTKMQGLRKELCSLRYLSFSSNSQHGFTRVAALLK